MKKWGWVILLMFFCLLLLGSSVTKGFGDDPLDGKEEWDMEEGLSGRDFVELGKLTTIEGTLFTEDDEWFLQSVEMIYEVHLGDHDYREGTGLVLKEGDEVIIYGYLYGDDMAVVSLTIGNKTFNFRTEQGLPLWGAFGGGQQRQEVLQQLERRDIVERAMQLQHETQKEEMTEEQKEESTK